LAVRIRLKRVGARKDPHYRVVVSDSRSPRDGRFIEEIGHYDPRGGPEGVAVKEDRAVHWMLRGALPSDTVRSLFKKLGIMESYRQAKAGGDRS